MQWTAVLIFLIIVVAATLTHTPTSGGSWLLKVLLLAIPLRIAVNSFLPPALEAGIPQPRVTVVSAALGAALAVFIVELIIFGWAHVALGATQSELSELLWNISVPLAWINDNFLITPQKSFADVCGTILGNSFFYGIPMFACWKLVHSAFSRNRVTQMGLTGGVPKDDED